MSPRPDGFRELPIELLLFAAGMTASAALFLAAWLC
jgi:hypothetical protein